MGRNRLATARVAAGLLALGATLLAGTPSPADETGRKAAEIARAAGDAVIHVKAVMKVRVVFQGREVKNAENEVEAIGTVIDPSGLTVLSNTNVDPTKAYEDILRKAKAGGEDPGQIDIEASFADVRMLLSDGTELPARVALRDKELDLVFVRPAARQAKPLPYVDLSKAAPDAATFDELVILGRLGAIGGRVPTASIHRIEAVVRKPRTYYLVDQGAVSGRLGSPAFALDGRVAGVFLLRATESQDGGSGPLELVFGGIGRLGLYPVILPAGEISEVAKQAAETREGGK